MKLLEQTPAKYDRGMRLLTLGRIDAIKREIADAWVQSGHAVLEIGCGAGALAALMTGRGARVTGIDVSDPMLTVARQAAPGAELFHMTAAEIDKLGAGRFDRIVSTLAFSELSEDEQDFVLKQAAMLLKPGGNLIVADEVRPVGLGARAIAASIRLPLAAITFLLTQNTTHALRRFESRLGQAGFRLVARKRYLLGTLALFVAEKG
jgi:demethylmenaquinone methyltransferase/2-methoxy-6-polyprenyl-1,4-benzoquinol methylase